MNEQKMEATDLSMQIMAFRRKKKLEPSDWIVLDKLIKQINKQKRNVSRKVLRSVQEKFEKVQNKYNVR